MTADEHRTRGELEDAQREESATARRRIEQADEYVSHYRSRMRSLEEGIFELASRHGATDDPRLRTVFAQVTHEVDENVRAGAAVVAGLEEEYRELQSRHALEAEGFQGKR
jgi:hypothetical protein